MFTLPFKVLYFLFCCWTNRSLLLALRCHLSVIILCAIESCWFYIKSQCQNLNEQQKKVTSSSIWNDVWIYVCVSVSNISLTDTNNNIHANRIKSLICIVFFLFNVAKCTLNIHCCFFFAPLQIFVPFRIFFFIIVIIRWLLLLFLFASFTSILNPRIDFISLSLSINIIIIINFIIIIITIIASLKFHLHNWI